MRWWLFSHQKLSKHLSRLPNSNLIIWARWRKQVCNKSRKYRRRSCRRRIWRCSKRESLQQRTFWRRAKVWSMTNKVHQCRQIKDAWIHNNAFQNKNQLLQRLESFLYRRLGILRLEEQEQAINQVFQLHWPSRIKKEILLRLQGVLGCLLEAQGRVFQAWLRNK